MGKYITLGNYNSHFKYILLYILFKLINSCFYGLNYYDFFIEIKFIIIESDVSFSNYDFIRNTIISYLGTLIIAYISVICNKIKNKLENRRTINQERVSRNPIILIHSGNEEEKNISFFLVIVIIFIWVFVEQALDIYSNILCHLDFWFFELIILAYLEKVLLHIEIYRHHIFVFVFSLIPVISKIITIFLEFADNDDNKEITKHYLYEKDNKWFWIPLGLFIYFILITLKAYSIIKVKWLMDLKYISANKLLILYGFTGTLFYFLFSTISSILQTESDSIFLNKSYRFDLYYKSFIHLYVKELIKEIIILVFGMITSYYIKYYYMMIIKYLTPVHIVFLTPMFYFFYKIILIIYNLIYCIVKHDFSKSFGNNSVIPLSRAKFSLDFSQDSFSFFGFLIYLEIIELNCFNLDYNLKDKMTKRAACELSKIDDCTRSTEESFNDPTEDLISDNTDESIENIINVSNDSNISY